MLLRELSFTEYGFSDPYFKTMWLAALGHTVVKPHVPAIRFPDRKNSPKPDVQEALKSMIFPFTAPSVTAQQAASDNPPGRNRATSVRQVASTPDTGDLLKSLPQKYRRRPVSTEEMEYIQVRHSILFFYYIERHL
ncbi:alpha-ketoglutarate dehydrogenase component 4 [Pyxicephalus adspersus]|uniref:alpha-ketoglutarate dehydrogenase component 4 n=1 Tax=Pyxicephalus adspersus TaxID=30357 RepID=UPI003B59D7FA